MRFARIYSDADGTSHWQDLDVELSPVDYAPPAPPIDLAAPFTATRALLFSIPAGWYGDWHPTPRRQLYINLSGRLEVAVSDGEIRVLGPGDVILVEDELAPGHTTRALGDEPSTGVIVHLVDAGSEG